MRMSHTLNKFGSLSRRNLMNKDKARLTPEENPYHPRNSVLEKHLYEVFKAGAVRAKAYP